MAERLVGSIDAIPEMRPIIVDVDGVEVGVLKVRGQVRAYENNCRHQGGPVCYGDVVGRREAVLDADKRVVGERLSAERFDLVCPWHGWAYDVLTGACIADRRLRLKAWEVALRDGQVYLKGPI